MKRLWALLVLSSCQSLIDGSREHFSKSFSCPLDRVEAKARTDLRDSSFRRKEEPPAEIAADPERLKMWQAKQDEQREFFDRGNEIFEMKGCGHEQFLSCHRGKSAIFCMSREFQK